MHLGLKLGLAARRGGGSSLLSLLQSSTAGFYYPMDTARMFEDDNDVSATQYVLSDSDPIGLHVDAMAGVTVTEGSPRTFDGLGDELLTNGGPTFVNTDDWTATNATLSVVSGNLVVTSSGAGTVSITTPWENAGGARYIASAVGSGAAAALNTYRIPAFTNFMFNIPLDGDPIIGVSSDTDTTAALTLFWTASGAGETYTLERVSIKELPGLHATQTTSADRPLWDETEEAWELDGVSDHINIPGAAFSGQTNSTLGMQIKTTDSIFILTNETGGFNPIEPLRSSGGDNLTAENTELYIDGVRIFNPSRSDAQDLVTDGEWKNLEWRAADWTGFNDGMSISFESGGTNAFSGFISGVFLTDLTAEADLNAIADAAMSERGITNLRNKTAEEVTQEATDGNLYSGSAPAVGGVWRPHNLLTWSEDLSNSAWVKDRVTVSGSTITAGGVDLQLVLETATTGTHGVYPVTSPIGNSFEFLIKTHGRRYIHIRNRGFGSVRVVIDSEDGSIIADTGNKVKEVTDLGDSVYLIKIDDTSVRLNAFGVFLSDSSAIENNFAGNSYAGDISKGAYIGRLGSYRSDLGGMADNPDTGDSYVPTTSSAVYPGSPLYLWQDDTGTTQTEDDQDPVGLILPNHELVVADGSPRTLSGLGPELVTNGDFSDGINGWVGFWSDGGGFAEGTSGGSVLRQSPTLNLEVGTTYVLSFDVITTPYLNVKAGGVSLGTSWADGETHLRIFTATATDGLQFAAGGGSNSQIDNVSLRPILGTPFLQPTSGDRPAFDAATGLLDFDGVSHHLTADLTGISDRTDMYVAMLLKTTDTLFTPIASGASGLFAAFAQTTGTASFESGVGTPSYYVDTALQSWADRVDAHAALATGSLVLLEVNNADFSNASWDTLVIGQSTFGSNFDGLALPLYLGPDPGIIERNILRKHWKQQFPDLSY